MEKNKKEKILMKNNIMVKAKYNLNNVENKFFQLILYNFQKVDDNTMIAEITIDKFKEISNKNDYKTISGVDDILTKLMEGTIYFKDNDGYGKARFINNYKFINNNSTIRIKADAEIYTMLFDYLKGYTPINLAIFFGFKSYYSQRFYELLRLWSNSKQVINYKIDELRDYLFLQNKYTLYKDFKRRVISTAVKELNEKADMEVDFKENKTGRKVTSIDFIVRDNDKRKYFQDKNNNKINYNNKSYTSNIDKILKFNDYEQRTYDYEKLERRLLGWDNNED